MNVLLDAFKEHSVVSEHEYARLLIDKKVSANIVQIFYVKLPIRNELAVVIRNGIFHGSCRVKQNAFIPLAA